MSADSAMSGLYVPGLSISPHVIAMIGVSSISWALFDMSRKKLSVKLAPTPIVVWLMLLQAPLFAILFKALFQEVWRIPQPSYYLPAMASVILNAVANVWFVESVRMAPLSLVIPVLSLTPVFSALGGFVLLGEVTTLRQGAGIFVIVACTMAIARTGGGQSRPDGVQRDEKKEQSQVTQGVLLMAGVSLLWALTPVLDKICLATLPAAEHAFLQCLTVSILLFAWLRFKKGSLKLGQLSQNVGWFTLAVGAAALALFAQLWSIQNTPVGLFEALKRSYGLLSALALGYFVFGEAVTRRKAVLVAAMGFGIAILVA